MAQVTVSGVDLTFPNDKGGVVALRAITFAVEEAEFLCILGKSGCGKTSLLNMLAGFLVPTQGQIRIAGQMVKDRGVSFGVVFQDLSQLFPWRTVRRNVEFGLEIRGTAKEERREAAEQFLRLVKLEKFADAHPHQLSSGMQQRVAIARALAYNPAVLLMDEPFAALDALTREDMQQLLEDVWQATRKTIIYVTHNVVEAVYLADRILVMTSHPGTIQSELKVSLPRPRNMLSVEFLEYQQEVVSRIRAATT
jgi:NitT/TauT family transport system ATP-binding protein